MSIIKVAGLGRPVYTKSLAWAGHFTLSLGARYQSVTGGLGECIYRLPNLEYGTFNFITALTQTGWPSDKHHMPILLQLFFVPSFLQVYSRWLMSKIVFSSGASSKTGENTNRDLLSANRISSFSHSLALSVRSWIFEIGGRLIDRASSTGAFSQAEMKAAKSLSSCTVPSGEVSFKLDLERVIAAFRDALLLDEPMLVPVRGVLSSVARVLPETGDKSTFSNELSLGETGSVVESRSNLQFFRYVTLILNLPWGE